MGAELPVQRLGRYTLVRSLGSGGMAELFLARADGIQGFAKLVAVKRILPHKAKNERFVRMLLNEARLVAALDHPNIATVYDIGVEDGEYYFAMEYVHGQDLRHVMKRAAGHQFRLENALHVAIGICAGLHHAHEARDPQGRSLEIVHRDVSPSNVLVSYDGAIKLVDFGVAKAASLVSETREGVIKGKYGFMSPEQCLGEALDRRSDVFAVGIILWEMTVGRRLYKLNGELASLQRVVYVDAPRPSRFVPDYPPQLEAIVMRALARDRATRYQSAQELQLELEQFALAARLPVSAISMAHQVRDLFRERLDAWHEAERAGRSLADHLAEAMSADSSSVDSSSSDDDDEPDELAREAEGAAAATAATRAGTATQFDRPRRPDASPVVAAPARRRGGVAVGLVLAFVVIATAGIAWFVRQRRDEPEAPTETGPIALATFDDAAFMPPGPSVADAAVEEDVPIEEAVIEEPVIDEPAEPIDVDAGTAVTPHRTKRGKHAVDKRAKRVEPTDAETARVDAGARADAAIAPDAAVTAEVKPPAGPAPGTVDAAKVRGVVRAHINEIQGCIARARMEDRDLTGRIVIRINLSPTGKVTSTSVASSTVSHASLKQCMADAVAHWTFPAPAGGVAAVISYPFAF